MISLKHTVIALLALCDRAFSEETATEQDYNPLSITIPHTVKFGDEDAIEPRHELWRFGEGVVPGAKITCLDCGTSGELKMQFKLNLGKTPELDKAIERIDTTDAPTSVGPNAKRGLQKRFFFLVAPFLELLGIAAAEGGIEAAEGGAIAGAEAAVEGAEGVAGAAGAIGSTAEGAAMIATAEAEAEAAMAEGAAGYVVGDTVGENVVDSISSTGYRTFSPSLAHKIEVTEEGMESSIESATAKEAESELEIEEMEQRVQEAEEAMPSEEGLDPDEIGPPRYTPPEEDAIGKSALNADKARFEIEQRLAEVRQRFLMNEAKAAELAADPPPPYEAVPPGIDTTGIELPMTIALSDETEFLIPAGTEPFLPMTEAMKAILLNWRASENKDLQRALVKKGQEMALAALNGETIAGEESAEPETNEKCEELGGLPFASSGASATGLSTRSDSPEGSAPLDKVGQWMKNHITGMTFEIEAMDDIIAQHQLEVFSKTSLKLAFNWEWYGNNRWEFNVATAGTLQDGGSLNWKPGDVPWKDASEKLKGLRHLKVDRTNKNKSPLPWNNKDKPKNKLDTKFATFQYEFSPVAIQVGLDLKGNTNMTLPGYKVTIPKGSKMTVDAYSEDILHDSFMPQVEYLDPSAGDFQPQEGISTSMSAKFQVKVLPKSPKKPKQQCKDGYRKSLKTLTQAASNFGWKKLKAAKDKYLPKWLSREGAKKAGFGDPLTIGAALTYFRLDQKFNEAKNVDNQCNKKGPIEHAFQTQSIFRIGFTPYMNIFFWKLDASVLGKKEKSPVATNGLWKSWELGNHCYSLDDKQAGLDEMKNVTNSASSLKHEDAKTTNETVRSGNLDLDKMSAALWFEEMAMSVNDTVRALAPTFDVPLEEVGLSEDEDTSYLVPMDEEDDSTFFTWAPDMPEPGSEEARRSHRLNAAKQRKKEDEYRERWSREHGGKPYGTE